tara:strand:- start:1654 stop:1917 length:264 start_codon:yes stop_codon:yes gene_type:complete
MKTIKIQINDKIGFHARTASIFSKSASEFKSIINIEFKDKKVNGKSMLSIMSLGVKTGDSVIISCEGEDEEVSINHLKNLINNNFNS